MLEVVGKILRVSDVVELFGIKRQTLFAWETKGKFPKRIKLGVKLYGWQEQEVLKWLQDCNKEVSHEAV